MVNVAEDLRLAVRALARSPGFALTAIATLALGIGINAAVYTLSKAVLFSGFPSVEDNDRIVYIASRRSACCFSYPDFADWRAQATSFAGMAAVHGKTVSLSDASGFPEGRDATEVSAGTFGLIGQAPVVGRDFSPADEAPGAAPVAIVSYRLWERRFAKAPAILGRVVRIDGVPTTVIGVMPAGFSFPQKQDLWLPLVPTPQLRERDNRNLWFAFGRLAPDATLDSARAEMESIGLELARDYPATNRNYMPAVRSFNEFFVGASENVTYVTMWGAVAFVLLIACANLANLMLARGMSRSREISVRMALGASGWRIVRYLLVESLTLSAAGGVLGWWIAKWIVHAYALAERGPGLVSWRVLDYSMDYRVVGYLAAVAIGTGALFGLAPAARLSRLDVRAPLREGERGASGGASGKRLSAVLVSVEVALAVVLLAGAGLMIRSYLAVATTDPGVATDHVLTGELTLPAARYPSAAQRVAFFDDLESRVEALPGVDSVAFASALPTWGARRVAYEAADAPVDAQHRPTASALTVSPGYFRTLEAPVLSGREFRLSDDGSGLAVALVNERFAGRRWPGESPLGKRLRLFDGENPGAWLTVVGVVPDIVQSDATRQRLEPLVYVPHRQQPRGTLWVLMRTRVPPAGLADDFRREVQALDADLPVLLGPYTLDQRLSEVYWDKQLYAVLFLAFGAIALLLAAVGLYAVIAYSVSRHALEIGIRMAVGADARAILALVFRQGMLPLGIGLAIGLIGAFGVTRVLESLLVRVSPTDPATFVAAVAVLVFAGSLGCWLPARRALHVDPVTALRHQ